MPSGDAVTLYLIRHGETAWNREDRIQGTCDVPLSAHGREQVARLSDLLRGFHFDAAYSSPLRRALETAKLLVSPRCIAPRAIASLVEMNCGVWEGLDAEARRQEFGDLMASWQADPWTTQIPGAESLRQVEARATAALQNILKQHPGGSVLVSGHAYLNRVILRWMLGLPYTAWWDLEMPNASCYILSVSVSHLERSHIESPARLLDLVRNEEMPRI